MSIASTHPLPSLDCGQLLDLNNPDPNRIYLTHIARRLSVTPALFDTIAPYSAAERSLVLCRVCEQMSFGLTPQLFSLFYLSEIAYTGRIPPQAYRLAPEAINAAGKRVANAIFERFKIAWPNAAVSEQFGQAVAELHRIEQRMVFQKMTVENMPLTSVEIEFVSSMDAYYRYLSAADRLLRQCGKEGWE